MNVTEATNGLAYYDAELITAVIKFITRARLGLLLFLSHLLFFASKSVSAYARFAYEDLCSKTFYGATVL